MKPLVFDLYCGLGGWSEAFIAHDYRAVGFDVERHDYGAGGYPGELVLRDVRSLTGADLVKQYGVPMPSMSGSMVEVVHDWLGSPEPCYRYTVCGKDGVRFSAEEGEVFFYGEGTL